MRKMKKLFIQIGVVAALVAIAVAATSAAFLFGGGFPGVSIGVSSSTVVNIANLRQQILSIGELATLQYDYTNVIDKKDSLKIKDWSIPLTEKSVIVVLDGTMKLGVDLSGITVEASEDTQTIAVTIPGAGFISHVIHEDTLRVLDEKSGLFNPIQIEDYTTLAASQKKAMEKKVAKDGLLARAENEAVKMLRVLIERIVPGGYTVNIACGEK